VHPFDDAESSLFDICSPLPVYSSNFPHHEPFSIFDARALFTMCIKGCPTSVNTFNHSLAFVQFSLTLNLVTFTNTGLAYIACSGTEFFKSRTLEPILRSRVTTPAL
jgi:hypothetical protein